MGQETVVIKKEDKATAALDREQKHAHYFTTPEASALTLHGWYSTARKNHSLSGHLFFWSWVIRNHGKEENKRRTWTDVFLVCLVVHKRNFGFARWSFSTMPIVCQGHNFSTDLILCHSSGGLSRYLDQEE
jgi:hypothetical protein